jgi:tRNA(Ile)-lysidine synthase
LAEIRTRHPEIKPEKAALIGVSGGRDSVALLHFLASQGWKKLIVAYLNHGLRGRLSKQDAAFVRALAKSHGLRCEIAQANISRSASQEKLSIETAGRNARRDFFLKLARRHLCSAVFLAHHAEDQAETVLQHLFRGSALHGVTGMLPVSSLGETLCLVRPALHTSRKDIDEYIATHGLRYHEDESNNSLQFTRNRVRHELIPLLDDIFRREVSPIITRFAEHARQDDDFAQASVRAFETAHDFHGSNSVLEITAPFLAQHPAVQSRIIRTWLTQQCGNTGTREVHAVLAALQKDAPKKSKLSLPGGALLRRDGAKLWVELPSRTKDRKPKSPRPSKHR